MSSPGELLILQRMVMAEPRVHSGCLVGIRRLRELWQGTRAAFDHCLFSLIERGVVEAHRHDYTASLSDAERADYLVIDGSVYVGVVLKLA